MVIEAGSLDITKFIKTLPTDKSKITSIYISKGVQAGTSISGLFAGFSSITGIEHLENLDTSDTTDMSSLFKDDHQLNNIDQYITKLNTTNVQNTNEMFAGSGINKFDLTKLTTKNIKSSSNMFANTSIQTITIPANTAINVGLPEGKYWKSNASSKIYTTDQLEANSFPQIMTFNVTDDPQTFDFAEMKKPDFVVTLNGDSSQIKPNVDLVDEHGNKLPDTKAKALTAMQDVYIKLSIPNDGKHKLDSPTTALKAHVSEDGKSIVLYPDVDKSVKIVDQTPSQSSTSETPSLTTSDSSTLNPTPQPNLSKPTKPTHKKSIKSAIRKVSALFKSKFVKLYTVDLKVENREVKAGSDWYSDEQMVVDSVTYYRISTDEWIAADDVYAYDSDPQVVTTKNGKNAELLSALGKISNRSLAPDTKWKSDRVININGKKYFRVSTNEFVSADDVQ
ncbi:BspA family leucine-rich repeat surface protein [Companilactobacillus sp.]|uniref:BspA family leucine-rich repeat surface protein n=1 Tax=Companilactobacillus sp. TaxID=2767905 RepID=UPI00262AC346|nr:BspA family leucine-rich repeat surface protein [Companilactobacillus sp.]